jgi:hypothetical protein
MIALSSLALIIPGRLNRIMNAVVELHLNRRHTLKGVHDSNAVSRSRRATEISGNIQWREDRTQAGYHEHLWPDGLRRRNIQFELRHPEIAAARIN